MLQEVTFMDFLSLSEESSGVLKHLVEVHRIQDYTNMGH